jgi:hypothetical protein
MLCAGLHGVKMSKIDTLIQELQQKKKKLDYLEYIKDILSGDQQCVDFVEVQEEVLGKLLPLIDKLALEIEDSVEPESGTKTDQLSSDDVMILKRAVQNMRDKASSKPQETRSSPQENSPYDSGEPHKSQQAPPKKHEKLPQQDKMNFAMDNRHLANKTVRVMSKDSDQVVTSGTVVGLDAPNVIVKTVEGHTIGVPLNKILLGESA